MSMMQHLSPGFIEEVKENWKPTITEVINPTEKDVEILSVILETCKEETISPKKLINIYKECQFPYFTCVQPLTAPVGFIFFLRCKNKILTEIDKQESLTKIIDQLKEYYKIVPYKFPEFVKNDDDLKIYAEQIYDNQNYPTVSFTMEKSIVENKAYKFDKIEKESSIVEIANEIDNIVYEYLYSQKLNEINIDISKKRETIDTLLIAGNDIAVRNKRGIANTIIFNEKYNTDIYLLNEMLKDITDEDISWKMISHKYDNDDIIIGYCNNDISYDNGIGVSPHIFYSENIKKQSIPSLLKDDIFKIKTKDVKDMSIEEMIQNDIKFTDVLIAKTRIGITSMFPGNYFTRVKVK